jgi:spermidine/putrescine transport system permease protein
MHNIWAVILIHVYTYLPFAILPLYSTIEKFDFGLLEAARDLGASHTGSLRKVLLPNIRSGIVTAVLFTFIPTLGSFAISDLVGGKDGEMIGNSIAYASGKGFNWPRASALSVILILISGIILLIYALINHQQAQNAKKEASQ